MGECVATKSEGWLRQRDFTSVSPDLLLGLFPCLHPYTLHLELCVHSAIVTVTEFPCGVPGFASGRHSSPEPCEYSHPRTARFAENVVPDWGTSI